MTVYHKSITKESQNRLCTGIILLYMSQQEGWNNKSAYEWWIQCLASGHL